jgi:hypothetical protein
MGKNQYAKMQDYWDAQRNIAKLRERLSNGPFKPGRRLIEDLLQEEERKLTAASPQI